MKVVGDGSDGVRVNVLVVRGLRKQKGREKERKTKIPLKKERRSVWQQNRYNWLLGVCLISAAVIWI